MVNIIPLPTFTPVEFLNTSCRRFSFICLTGCIAVLFMAVSLTSKPQKSHLLRLESTMVRGIQHIYVVGCGHSGTSLLQRVLTNLPGIYCIPSESNVHLLRTSDEERAKQIAGWDAAAAAGNFTCWLEKTPAHITRIGQILERNPTAKVILIVRDGRDVVASLMQRGYGFQAAVTR